MVKIDFSQLIRSAGEDGGRNPLGQNGTSCLVFMFSDFGSLLLLDTLIFLLTTNFTKVGPIIFHNIFHYLQHIFYIYTTICFFKSQGIFGQPNQISIRHLRFLSVLPFFNKRLDLLCWPIILLGLVYKRLSFLTATIFISYTPTSFSFLYSLFNFSTICHLFYYIYKDQRFLCEK